MAPDTTTETSAKPALDHDPQRGGLLAMAISLVFFACMALVRWWNPTGDHAHTNIFTLILGAAAIAVPLFWMAFGSRYSPLLRFSPLALVVFGIAGFFAYYRIGHVSGELVPHFTPRWAAPRDAQLQDHRLLRSPSTNGEATNDGSGAGGARAAAGANATVVDLSRTGDHDFPQFLGPQRDGAVRGVNLAQDWSRQPPRQLWRRAIGAGWSGFAAVNGFAVTMEQRGAEELVTCYRIQDGELMWFHSVEARHRTLLGGVGPRSTPTIFAGTVYALGATGVFRCLNGVDGQVLWEVDLVQRYGGSVEQDLQEVAWGRAGSPLIVDNKVIVPVGGPPQGPFVTLTAFDRETGQVIWDGGERQISYSSPTSCTLAGAAQIVYVAEDHVCGYDPVNGAEIWSHPWPGHSNADANNSQAVPLSGGRLLLSKGYGGGAELLELQQPGSSAPRVRSLWKNESVLKTKFTNAVISGDMAIGLSDGILECVSLEDGRRLWKRGRYGHGQILLVGKLLLVQTESGEIILLQPTRQRGLEKGRFAALSGKSWATLCLAGPYLLVRNAEEAACYELPLENSAGN